MEPPKGERSPTVRELERRELLAAIVRVLELVGPDMDEIARRLKEPRKRVVDAFRSNIERRGYRIVGRHDRGALGLRRASAVTDVAEEYADRIPEVVDAMMGRWYLDNYARTLPDRKFFFDFALPEEHYDRFPRLLNGMKKAGLITKVHRVLRFSERRYRPMRADQFDFKRGKWDFEWSQLSSCGGPPGPTQIRRQNFDAVDLSLLDWILPDAARPLEEVAERAHVNLSEATIHRQHIIEKHLIQFYSVNWMKTHKDPELGIVRSRKHRYAFFNINVLGPDPEERAKIGEMLRLLPYLNVETWGPDYSASICVPVELLVETMSYVRDVLTPVAKKAAWYMIDSTCAASLTPPYTLFDDSRGEWIFDLEEQMARLQEQMGKMKGERHDAIQDSGGPSR